MNKHFFHGSLIRLRFVCFARKSVGWILRSEIQPTLLSFLGRGLGEPFFPKRVPPILPLLAALLLLFPAGAWGLGLGFRGPVAKVLDGDSLVVLKQGRPIEVRLYGVDCPERDQPYEREARSFTARLALRQEVTVRGRTVDEYGRVVAEVRLPDGRWLNQELVRAGLAWWYQRYAPDNAELRRLEAAARAARLGLWRNPHPVPPWVFRQAERGRRRR